MATCEEKKDLPLHEQPVGGVFPDEIAKIKQQAQAGNNHRRLRIVAVCVLVVVLLAVGGTMLGLYLHQESVLSRSRKLTYMESGKLYHETVETDTDDNTDTFYTESDNGAAAVMFDHNKGLKAYKITGQNICFIVAEDDGEDQDVKEVATAMESKEEGSIEEVKKGGTMTMSLDESRTGTPELSEAMSAFCGDLEPRWSTLSHADGQGGTGGIALIAPGKMDPGKMEPTEKKGRVKRFWGRRRRRRRRVNVNVNVDVKVDLTPVLIIIAFAIFG